uniref:MARVEL domain-containing protein n=1 Tax=Gasterosteus aculeatus aculeatus TaxID=481459 RepID=A0AAQ4RGL3_GASAC
MSHTVITSTTTAGRTSGDGALNLGYTRTIPGLLKLGQMLALLVAFLCVRCARGWPSWAVFQYFEVVALWFLMAFLVFFLMHLFRLQAKMPCINWPLTEFFHYSVGTILILIASIVGAVKSGGVSALVAGSISTLCCPAPKWWKEVSEDIRTTESLHIFRLKTHLFRLYLH